MNIVLFSELARYALGAAALVLLIATIIAIKRGSGRLGAALGVGALLTGGALLTEALVALTVWLAAPDTADFNEYRWIVLAPWGRVGLALGGVAVIAIVALSWRATRGASGWRRSALIAVRAGAAVGA
ncbi:MAG TPA: hypothetical protein VIU61_19525, partial [Kofleriaceae bacterium]